MVGKARFATVRHVPVLVFAHPASLRRVEPVSIVSFKQSSGLVAPLPQDSGGGAGTTSTFLPQEPDNNVVQENSYDNLLFVLC